MSPVATNVFSAGQETTVRLLGTAVRVLSERPEIQQALRRDRKLVPNFVEEALRIESPVKGDFRLSRVPTSVGGVHLPAGTTVMVLNGAANRDPRRFEDPDTFDPARKNARQHLAFGRGIHSAAVPESRPAMTEPRFAVGDRVRTRPVDPPHHSRLPRYARGHVGEVVEVQGKWPLADDKAQGDWPCGGNQPRTGCRSSCGSRTWRSPDEWATFELGDRGAGAPAGGTAIGAGLTSDEQLDGILGQVLSGSPANGARVVARAWVEARPLSTAGTVDDIANAAVFLSSERSRYITGTVLPVDGGMTAGIRAMARQDHRRPRRCLLRPGRNRIAMTEIALAQPDTERWDPVFTAKIADRVYPVVRRLPRARCWS